jgi:hypothetical protein
MRVEDAYKKDASAGKFKKFCVEADITVTADHLSEEEELVEICRRIRDTIDEEVSELEEDLIEDTDEKEEKEKEEPKEARVSD